jgi:hypothetical protein
LNEDIPLNRDRVPLFPLPQGAEIEKPNLTIDEGSVAVTDGVADGVAVGEGVGVLLPVCVDVEDVVPEDVAIALAEAEDVTVPDIEGVFVGAALPETDIDAVKLGEELDELVGLLEIV